MQFALRLGLDGPRPRNARIGRTAVDCSRLPSKLQIIGGVSWIEGETTKTGAEREKILLYSTYLARYYCKSSSQSA